MINATKRCGGVYIYANQCGCDGSRLYFDGSSIIVSNGNLLAQCAQFSLADVEVVAATIDLNDIRSQRGFSCSLREQASRAMIQGSFSSLDGDALLSFYCKVKDDDVIKRRKEVLQRKAQIETGKESIQDKENNDIFRLNDKEEEQPLYSLQFPSVPIKPFFHSEEEECTIGPACWLWDYVRRSNAGGFLLPLSGGADSAAVATIVGIMCSIVMETFQKEVEICCEDKNAEFFKKGSLSSSEEEGKDGSEEVSQINCQLLSSSSLGGGLQTSGSTSKHIVVDPDFPIEIELARVLGWTDQTDGSLLDLTPQKLASYLFHTIYMGTINSSANTRRRAKNLASQIGSYHLDMNIDIIVQAVITAFAGCVGKRPHFLIEGGTLSEDLALQNIQARIRMVMAYLFAQLLPWIRGRKSFLLTLGSSNVDEALRGYMTKYDCSSADLNPIGSISKIDLKRTLKWASLQYGFTALREIVEAPPTAELRPNTKKRSSQQNKEVNNDDGESQQMIASEMEHAQDDEEDMGMTYNELSEFGRLRKVNRCGPYSMFYKLLQTWKNLHTPEVIAEKVKRFFVFYSINRHKMVVVTPAYHAENYSPDDNRFDLRPFLYNTKWTRQFKTIDELITKLSNTEQG